MSPNKKHITSPIYAFTIAWVVCALIFPLYRIWAMITAAVISLIAALVTSSVVRYRIRRQARADAQEQTKVSEKKEEAEKDTGPRYAPEVEAILSDGKLAIKEMGRLYSSISSPDIRKKINEIMAVSDKIFRDAIDDPSDVPQIRKFLDFYLPTTIKLLNAYDRMGAQDIAGENIDSSMRRIEDMLDSTISAYNRQLDALFANQAADIQTDIDVMNGMLAREGLGGQSYLDIKDFMKQYEKQKGTTQNG